MLLCSHILSIQTCYSAFFLTPIYITPIGNLDFIFGKHAVWPLSHSGCWIMEATMQLEECLTLRSFLSSKRCWLPVILGLKQRKKTNSHEALPLCPRQGHSYSTKGDTLLYATEKASLSSPSPEQWGPAWGEQAHLHAAVCRFQDHKGQSKGP